MNTNDLRYYLAICQEKSFAQAAKSLFLTQQGVGKIVKRLETELGVPLLIRTSGGIEPTECGLLLEKRAKYIIDYIESMEQEFQGIAWSNQGAIRLASAYGILNSLSADCLWNFKKQYAVDLQYTEHPDVQVEMMVNKGRANIGFAVQPVDDRCFDWIPLNRHRLYAIVNKEHPLSQKQKLRYQDFHEQNMIIENKEFKLHQFIEQRCKQLEVQPNLVFETSGLILCHKMVRQNKGISITVDYALQDTVYENVVAIPLEDPEAVWEPCIILKKGTVLSHNMQTFIEFILGWKENQIDFSNEVEMLRKKDFDK